jgi:uncharacterized protein (TIGR00106 family)
MLFGVTVLPLGVSGSLVGPVADVVQAIDDARLDYEINGISTVIEGGWDEIMPVLQRAQQALSRRHGRVFMVIMIDDHEGVDRLRNSVKQVEGQVSPELPMS